LENKFRLKLFFPLLLSVILVSVVALSIDYYIQRDALTEQTTKKVSLYQERFESLIEKEAKILDGYLALLEKDSQLQELFLQKNREKLNIFAQPIYKNLNQNVDITHLYFLEKSGEVFLRAHESARYSDIVKRYTFLKAKEMQSPFYGIEFGIKKNYTLRVVHPWVVDGEVIGYLELGKEIDKLMEALASQMNIEIYLAVNKQIYQNSPEFVQERVKDTPQTKEHFIVYNTWKVPENIEELLQQKDTMRHIKKDGRVFLDYIVPLVDVSQKELGYILYLIDITAEHNSQLKAIEKFALAIVAVTLLLLGIAYFFIRSKENRINSLTKELASQHEFLQTLIETAPLPIFYKDSKGRYIHANGRFLEMFGYKTLDQIYGKTVFEVAPEHIANIYSQKDRELFENPDSMQTYEFMWHNDKSGSSKDVVFYKKAFFNADGSVGGLIGLIVDISERKAIEKELKFLNESLVEQVENEISGRMRAIKEKQAQETLLMQQSKMAELGNMMSAIAHQWKQPINVISLLTDGITDVLEYEENPQEILEETRERILQQIDFMVRTMNDFRNFHKPSEKQVNFIACDAIEAVLNMFRNYYEKDNVTVTIHPHEHFQVHGHKNELQQVMLNILNNAKDAIKESGKKYGTIDCHFEREGDIGIIRIKDNGGGIPESLLPDELFKAYASTKGEKGTGIGLQMSKNIIEEHMNGKIWVHNVEDGAEFVIELPVVKEES